MVNTERTIKQSVSLKLAYRDMAKQTDTNKESASNPLDLSQLTDLSFGPDWASTSGKKRSSDSYQKFDGNDRRSSRSNKRFTGGQRDRRDQRDRRGSATPRRDNRDSRYNRGGQEGRNYAPFEPTVDVIFVSQDKPFEVLLKAMRTTFKTYELFEIARIILGKENRFVAIISAKPDADEKKIFVSVPDQLPFDTREAAINHVVNNHLERFFDISEVEVEPPKGNFQMVNRCKLTGELLAPPNFHRYQDILKEHYQKNISNLSFERFVERVEAVKDPEVVQEWIDKMKITRQYTLKQKETDESPKVVLSALEDVRYYLTTERKNEVFVAKDKIRLPGEKIELLPKGDIRRSIEREIEIQRRFPLVTSNHLRGRLRRCNLHFLKKGAKGITYVCSVKRKPRYKDTVFSENIQKLIDYIEAHPRTLVEDLLNDYKPEGVESITEDTQKTVALDLRWLIGAGYVSEFGNSELFADQPLTIQASEDKNTQATMPSRKKGGKHKAKENKRSEAKPESEKSAEAPATKDAVAETPATEAEAAEAPATEDAAPDTSSEEQTDKAAPEETLVAEVAPVATETAAQEATQVVEEKIETVSESEVEEVKVPDAETTEKVIDSTKETPETATEESQVTVEEVEETATKVAEKEEEPVVEPENSAKEDESEEPKA